jgi:hypothetical protein
MAGELLLFQSKRSVKLDTVSWLLVNGLVPLITSPSSVWNNDSPAFTSRTFVRSIITACSIPRLVIVAATSFIFLLTAVSRTWPPIIRKGLTTASGLNPLLAKIDLPSLTVSKSAKALVPVGEVFVGLAEVPSITL